MTYHQLLGTAESRMDLDEIEREARDSNNLLALAALQMIDTKVDEAREEFESKLEDERAKVDKRDEEIADLKTDIQDLREQIAVQTQEQ